MAYSGKTANATIGSIVMQVTGWSISDNTASIDATNTLSSGKRRVVAGIESWSGSADFHCSATASVFPVKPSAIVSMTLIDGVGGHTISGNVLVTDLTGRGTVPGIFEGSCAFDGDFTLTVA